MSNVKVEKQEPVAWVEVIDRHKGPYYFHGKELLDVGKHNLYTAPQPCPECEKLKAERDNAWEELRRVRDAVVANIEESTFDEVRRVVAERDELAAQVEQMRAEVELIKGGAENWKGGWSGTIQACDRALALPDLSTSILNRVRAEALRKAADIFESQAIGSANMSSIRALAADMGAGKCQVY